MAGKYYGSLSYDEHMDSTVINFRFYQIQELKL